MCLGDTFCCCFSIKTGSVIMSTFLFTLGLLGFLLFPFLPYSGQDMGQFFMVYGYTFLLMIAFALTLFAALKKSAWILFIGILLGIICFCVWLFFMLESFSSLTPEFPDNNYCLGLRCPESHWLVPREIVKLQNYPTEQITYIPESAGEESINPYDVNWIRHSQSYEPRVNLEESVENVKSRLDNQEESTKTIVGRLDVDKPEETGRNYPESIKNIECRLNAITDETKRNYPGSIKNIEGRLDAITDEAKRNYSESIKNIEGRLDAITDEAKRNYPESIKNIEGRLDAITDEATRNYPESIKNIEGRLDAITDEAKRNYPESIKNIEGRLDALTNDTRRYYPKRIKNIANRLDVITNDTRRKYSQSFENIESERPKTSDSRIEIVEKLLNDLAVTDEPRSNIPNLHKTGKIISKDKLKVHNFQQVYRFQCRQDKIKPQIAASYLNAAFFLRQVNVLLIALAIIYGILFLCALLTLLKQLQLFQGDTLEDVLCCGVKKTSRYYKNSSEKSQNYNTHHGDYNSSQDSSYSEDNSFRSQDQDDCLSDMGNSLESFNSQNYSPANPDHSQRFY